MLFAFLHRPIQKHGGCAENQVVTGKNKLTHAAAIGKLLRNQ